MARKNWHQVDHERMAQYSTDGYLISNQQLSAQLAGLGGSASQIRTGGLIRRGRGLTVIPLGDSITQAGSTLAAGLWQFSSGYAETSIRMAGPRFKQLSNAGIAGQTSTQILARLYPDVLAYSPDICIILAGTNDYASGMANSAFVTLMNNVEKMVMGCLSAGVLPVVVVPPPKSAAVEEAKKGRLFYYRLAQFWNVPLFDMYAICADPSTGGYLSGYGPDGTHPSTTAIAAIAAQFSLFLKNIDVAYCAPYLGVVSETGQGAIANMIRNGSFAKITTPPAPDGWTINSTSASYTTPAATYPYTGNTFTYTKTGAGLVYPLYGSQVSNSYFAAGDVIQFNGRISSSGRSSPSGFAVGLDFAGSGGNARPMNSWLLDGDFAFSHECIVPAGATGYTPTLSTSDVGGLAVNNLTAINLTAINAIWRPGQQA